MIRRSIKITLLLLIVVVDDKALEEIKSVLGSLIMEVGLVGNPFSIQNQILFVYVFKLTGLTRFLHLFSYCIIRAIVQIITYQLRT